MDDDEQEETIAGPLTCRVIYTETLSGDGKIGLSDGREYLYEIAGCGEAVHVKQLNGKYLTEIPTSEEETYELGEAELSLLEVVLSKIS